MLPRDLRGETGYTRQMTDDRDTADAGLGGSGARADGSRREHDRQFAPGSMLQMSEQMATSDPGAVGFGARSNGSRLAVASKSALSILTEELVQCARCELDRNSVPSCIGLLEKAATKDLVLLGLCDGRLEVRPVDNPSARQLVLQHPEPSGHPLGTVPAVRKAKVRAVAVSRVDPTHVATAMRGRIHLWTFDGTLQAVAGEIKTGQPQELVTTLDWHSLDAQLLAAADSASGLKVIDRRTVGGEPFTGSSVISREMAHSGAPIRAVRWLEKHEHILSTVGDDGVLRLWDTRNLRSGEIDVTPAHIGPATALGVSPGFFATGGGDGSIRLWVQFEEHGAIGVAQQRLSSTSLLGTSTFRSCGPAATHVRVRLAKLQPFSQVHSTGIPTCRLVLAQMTQWNR